MTSPSCTSPPSEATSASRNNESAPAGHGKGENGGCEGEGALRQSSKSPGAKDSKDIDGSDGAVTTGAPSESVEGNGTAVGSSCDSSGSTGVIGSGSEGAKKVNIPGREDANQRCPPERPEKPRNDSMSATSVVASRGRQKNSSSPLLWAGAVTGAGGNGARFMQRDIDAAKLMIRARRLDLAAREWVGVRGLLLRRATAAAAGKCKKMAESEANGGDSKELMQTGTALLGGGEDRAGERGVAKTESVSGSSGIGAEVAVGCSKILVLQPTVSYKGGGKGDSGEVGLAPVAELESVLEALAKKGDLVKEKPGEERDFLGDSGVGWGGWESGVNEQVTEKEIEPWSTVVPSFINIIEPWKANKSVIFYR